VHLIEPAIVAGGSQEQLLADRPETQQADAELALQPARPIPLELPFDGIANVRGDVLEVRQALGIPGDALPIIFDAQEMLAAVASARDGDVARGRIDAVLDEFSDGFQGILLRQGDDRNGVPIVADAKPAGVLHFKLRVYTFV
jgi:hypothetical protein